MVKVVCPELMRDKSKPSTAALDLTGIIVRGTNSVLIPGASVVEPQPGEIIPTDIKFSKFLENTCKKRQINNEWVGNMLYIDITPYGTTVSIMYVNGSVRKLPPFLEEAATNNNYRRFCGFTLMLSRGLFLNVFHRSVFKVEPSALLAYPGILLSRAALNIGSKSGGCRTSS